MTSDTRSPGSSGECEWCQSDFSQFGRFFGSLAATLHALRHHWGAMELMSEGADAEEISENKRTEWQCPECEEWHYVYRVEEKKAVCPTCQNRVPLVADIPHRPRE